MLVLRITLNRYGILFALMVQYLMDVEPATAFSMFGLRWTEKVFPVLIALQVLEQKTIISKHTYTLIHLYTYTLVLWGMNGICLFLKFVWSCYV
jgi:hypothetical protein